jgi:hypothetical protein
VEVVEQLLFDFNKQRAAGNSTPYTLDPTPSNP